MKKKPATLKDIATLLGVHVSTVSRTLSPNTKSPVAEDLAEKIRATAREMNYRQNPTAYSLRTRKSLTIGVVIPDITNSVFPPILRGIEDVLTDAGYISIIVNTDGDARKERDVILSLRLRGVDGIILSSPLVEDTQILEIVEEPTAVVTVNRMLTNRAVSSVTNDDASGIEQALRHVVALGHRRIAHISGPLNSSTGLARCAAFESVAQTLGLDGWRDLIIHATSFREQEGYRCALALLDAGHPFTAVIAGNDLIAIGAIDAFKSRNLACPRDISVTGFNDIPFVDRLEVPLTTVRIQGYDAGRRAAIRMLHEIEDPSTASEPQHEVLPVSLIVRQTTGPAPVPQP